MKKEYDLDYRRARPNRFASRLRGAARTIVLDPDVASVFTSSKAVNQILRSVIAALPGKDKRRARPGRGRKAV
jgi:hypothetical protein